MIRIAISDDAIAEVEFENPLTADDFAAMRRTLDGYINEHDRAPNLLIHVHEQVRWESFHALREHFRFVRDHHRLVQKLAVVGDVLLLSLLPEIADHFVSAKIRRFPQRKLAEARAWLAAKDDDPGDFEVLDGFPGDVLAVRLKGIITGKAYRDTLVPLIEARLKAHDRLKFLAVVDKDFISYTADAAWDDMLLGIRHWNAFSRIALVTDVDWLRVATRLFAPLIPGEFHLFALDEMEDAASWIRR